MDQVPAEPIELTIEGMTCAGCTASVSRALGNVAGVTSVSVDLATGRARIEGHAARQDLERAVAAAGFDVGVPHA